MNRGAIIFILLMGFGYASCVNLTDSSTYDGKVVNISGVYYINDNIVLCNDTYLTNYTLIVVNASGVSLDCNGSTLRGDGGSSDIGIHIYQKQNVIVHNCNIGNFGKGVLISLSYNCTVNASFFLNNTRSIEMNTSDGNLITGCTAINQSNFLYLSRSNYNRVENNNITGTMVYWGIYLYNSVNNTVFNNTISRFAQGIYLVTGSNYTNISDNTVFNCSYGLTMSGNFNRIEGLKAYSNTVAGVYFTSAYISSMNNSVIFGNNASSSTNGVLVYNANRINITNSTFYWNSVGLRTDYISWILISDCAFYNNSGYGTFFMSSNNVTIENSRFMNNGAPGIYMNGGSNNSLNMIAAYCKEVYPVWINMSNNTHISNLTIYRYRNGVNASNYLFVNAIGLNMTMRNFSICYNENEGCIEWSSLTLRNLSLLNQTNVLVDPSFVSVNLSKIQDFSSGVNISLRADSCVNPADFIVYTAPGFPQSREEIISMNLTYTPLEKVCVSGQLLRFGVSSLSGYTIMKVSSPSSHRRHKLKILEINDQYGVIGNAKNVSITVTNKGDYNEREVRLYIDCVPAFTCDDFVFELIRKGEAAEGTVSLIGNEVGNYTLVAYAKNDETSAAREFKFIVLPQCLSDLECDDDEYCNEGKCNRVRCERGYASNHTCNKYECYFDYDCKNLERCIDHKCHRINYTLSLDVNSTVINGTSGIFSGAVYEDGIAKVNVTVAIVSPDGNVTYALSNDSGRFSIGVALEGEYLFYLLKDPDVKAYGYAIKADLPPRIEEIPPIQDKPQEVAAAGKLEEVPECCLLGMCGKLFGICWYYWLLLLLVLMVVIIVLTLMKRRKHKLWRHR